MIPGFVIAIITFPGVIVHEVAHMLFCKIRGVPIFDVCYFRVGNPSGYVIHGETDNFATSFLIAVGPFIVNSLLCILICSPALVPVRVFGVKNPISYFILWLGISIGMHSFPSTVDAKSLLSNAKKSIAAGNILALVAYPIVLLIYAANIASVFWADYLYGVAIGLILPSMLL
jgi:hypothetical protein